MGDIFKTSSYIKEIIKEIKETEEIPTTLVIYLLQNILDIECISKIWDLYRRYETYIIHGRYV